MKRRVILLVALLSPLVLLIIATFGGLRINRSHSLPLGLYWQSWKTPGRGDLVFFLPPHLPYFDLARERGYIEDRELMLKRIVASSGDVISIDADGVSVNGKMLQGSTPMTKDPAGRPLPVFHVKQYRLQEGEVLLMSDYSAASYDARYFGPIQSTTIQSVVHPVWTW
jgi:conjugative transfer signal peptidase TraF